MSRFLIVFDRLSGKLLELRVAGSTAEEAIRARLTAEDAHKLAPSVEVVILNAESEADLRKTHARYFESVGKMIDRAASME